MINLSERLQTITSRISTGETMADIGTDHGFLPISLIERRISPKVIMTDVSRQSLKKAKQNYELNGCLGQNVDFRTGDGLTVLKNGEVDTVVIAGMGGKLIIDIMKADIEHTCSFRKFIFQPRIGQGHLRKWLIENGFIIIYEDLALEGKYIPEIITAVSPGWDISKQRDDKIDHDKHILNITGEYIDSDDRSKGKTGDDMFYKIPPWIVKAAGPVEAFLEKNRKHEKIKLENVMLSKTRNEALETSICEDIYYLKDLLEEYRYGKKKG